MSQYAALLDSMMHSLLNGDTTPARMLYRDKPDFSAEDQLSVYIHGYRMRRQKVIRNIYPALHYYLGKDAFYALVDGFITATPSHHFNIDRQAVAFGHYAAATSDDVFARELATLESVLREVYSKPETPPLNQDWLQQQTPQSLTDTPLYLRTASKLMAFLYPVSNYMTAFHGIEKPEIPSAAPQYLIVLRDNNEMQRVPLDVAEYTLLGLLAEGYTLGTALASESFAPYANSETLAADFQHWFSHWVNEGVFRLE